MSFFDLGGSVFEVEDVLIIHPARVMADGVAGFDVILRGGAGVRYNTDKMGNNEIALAQARHIRGQLVKEIMNGQMLKELE